jgi:hypothetical protein
MEKWKQIEEITLIDKIIARTIKSENGTKYTQSDK